MLFLLVGKLVGALVGLSVANQVFIPCTTTYYRRYPTYSTRIYFLKMRYVLVGYIVRNYSVVRSTLDTILRSAVLRPLPKRVHLFLVQRNI